MMKSLMKGDIYCFINAKPLSLELHGKLIVLAIPQNIHTNNSKVEKIKMLIMIGTWQC